MRFVKWFLYLQPLKTITITETNKWEQSDIP